MHVYTFNCHILWWQISVTTVCREVFTRLITDRYFCHFISLCQMIMLTYQLIMLTCQMIILMSRLYHLHMNVVMSDDYVRWYFRHVISIISFFWYVNSNYWHLHVISFRNTTEKVLFRHFDRGLCVRSSCPSSVLSFSYPLRGLAARCFVDDPARCFVDDLSVFFCGHSKSGLPLWYWRLAFQVYGQSSSNLDDV
jgi:hypothetical protein